MGSKKRFVATWSSLAGAFHDADTLADAIAFARAQAQFNTWGHWSVTDMRSKTLIAQGGA